MNKITNKIFISILLIVFSAIVLGTTTYAWFTLTGVASVEPLNASVTTGEGMEMSLDGDQWFSSLSTEVINDFLFSGVSPKYPNFKFRTNTSSNGIDIEGYDGSIATGYIEFDVKIRTPNNGGLKVYWTDASLNSTKTSWIPDVPSFVNAKGETLSQTPESLRDYYAADSTRVSVKGPDSSVIIFELPNSDSNTELGEFTGDISGANGAVNYYVVKVGEPPRGALEVAIPDTVVDNDSLDNNPLVTLDTDSDSDSYFDGSITIRIWIEGWDPDCLNPVLNQIVTVGLVFEARVS